MHVCDADNGVAVSMSVMHYCQFDGNNLKMKVRTYKNWTGYEASYSSRISVYWDRLTIMH